jgi:hypothetical protein
MNICLTYFNMLTLLLWQKHITSRAIHSRSYRGSVVFVATPFWGSCEVATHTPENGTWESFGTPKNSERDCRGQNTFHWDVLYTVGNLLKCKCPKWPLMSHLDICSISYGRKKGRESNWQFDSQPLKVENWPNFGACRGSVTHHWKTIGESYNFGSYLV